MIKIIVEHKGNDEITRIMMTETLQIKRIIPDEDEKWKWERKSVWAQ